MSWFSTVMQRPLLLLFFFIIYLFIFIFIFFNVKLTFYQNENQQIERINYQPNTGEKRY